MVTKYLKSDQKFFRMADLLGKIDPTAAGVCLASTIFGVAVGYIWSTRSSGKQCCNTTIKKECDKVLVQFFDLKIPIN